MNSKSSQSGRPLMGISMLNANQSPNGVNITNYSNSIPSQSPSMTVKAPILITTPPTPLLPYKQLPGGNPDLEATSTSSTSPEITATTSPSQPQVITSSCPNRNTNHPSNSNSKSAIITSSSSSTPMTTCASPSSTMVTSTSSMTKPMSSSSSSSSPPVASDIMTNVQVQSQTNNMTQSTKTDAILSSVGTGSTSTIMSGQQQSVNHNQINQPTVSGTPTTAVININNTSDGIAPLKSTEGVRVASESGGMESNNDKGVGGAVGVGIGTGPVVTPSHHQPLPAEAKANPPAKPNRDRAVETTPVAGVGKEQVKIKEKEEEKPKKSVSEQMKEKDANNDETQKPKPVSQSKDALALKGVASPSKPKTVNATTTTPDGEKGKTPRKEQLSSGSGTNRRGTRVGTVSASHTTTATTNTPTTTTTTRPKTARPSSTLYQHTASSAKKGTVQQQTGDSQSPSPSSSGQSQSATPTPTPTSRPKTAPGKRKMGDSTAGTGDKSANFNDQFAAFSKFGDTASDGKHITLSNSDKWMKQARVIDAKKITTTDTSICFKKLFKTQKKVGIDEFKTYVDELAKSKKIEPKELMDKLTKCGAPGLSTSTKAQNVGVVERLTDTSKYTGSHKERFDASGKGKGIEGRRDVADSSGYVAAFKEKLEIKDGPSKSPTPAK